MTQPEEELETLLKTPAPYLEDQGFTQRVMQRLPPRRTSSPRNRVLWGAAAAAAVALALGPGRELPHALSSGAFGWSGLGVLGLSFAALAVTAVSALLREAQGA